MTPRGTLGIIPEDEGATIVFAEYKFKSRQVGETYRKIKELIEKAL